MTYRVEIEPPARRDMLAAYRWYEDAGPAIADRWYAELKATIASLGHMPGRWPVARDLGGLPGEVRRALFGSGRGTYHIYFDIAGDIVRVLSIRHGARAPLGPDDLAG